MPIVNRRPAFMFFPADWRKDTGLQSCSIVARGVWHELLCVMHECVPYGHLARNGKALDDSSAARLIHVEERDFRRALRELSDAGVISRNEDGVIYSRRMVRDETLRNMRARAGKLGGNPALLAASAKPKPEPKADPPALPPTPVDPPEPEAPPTVPVAAQKRINGHRIERATRLPKPWNLPDEWRDWAMAAHHLEAPKVIRMSLVFRDFWHAKGGKDAAKIDWFATWRNWVRKDVGDP